MISRRKKLGFVTIVALAPPLLLIGGLEAAARLFIWWRHGVPGKSYGLYQYDAELGAVQRAHAYNTNSQTDNWGFRGTHDVEPGRRPNTLRVYCSGGSTTYCYNLATEEAWPNLLETKLRGIPGHAGDEVLNAGQICFSLEHEYRLARRLVPELHPDAVVLYTGINEPMNAGFLVAREGRNLDRLMAERQWGVAARSIDQASWFLRASALARYWHYYVIPRLAKKSVAAAAEAPPEPVAAPRVAASSVPMHPWVEFNFTETLGHYLAFLRESGVRPILVRWGDSGLHDRNLDLQMRALRERAVERARAGGAEICDAAKVMESRGDRADLFIASGVHVTRRGADVLSDIVLGCLLRDPRAPLSTATSPAAPPATP